MDARVVLLMVFSPPSLRYGAEIDRTDVSKLSLSARYRMTIFTLIKMLVYVALIFEFVPLRHVEWRSGTGFQKDSVRHVVSRAFSAFVCKPSKQES